MGDKVTVLSRVELFASLSQTDLATIAAWFREEDHEADAYLFHEGDEAIRFWVVKTGQVKIIKYGPGGKEIVIEMISPGEIFGGASLLLPYHPATAQALSHVSTLSLNSTDYRKLLQSYPAVAIRIIEMLGDRLLGVIRMRMLISQRVEQRIALILLKMAGKCGVPYESGIKLNISMTRQDIADLADTTIETTIRIMSSFRKEGLIKTERGGYVIIQQPDQLREISQRDPAING